MGPQRCSRLSVVFSRCFLSSPRSSRVDVFELEGEYRLAANVPGCRASDVSVELDSAEPKTLMIKAASCEIASKDACIQGYRVHLRCVACKPRTKQ